MRFTFEGATYAIEFQRDTHVFKVYDPILDGEKEVPSRYKYTTVRLVLLGSTKEANIVFRTARVGCYFKEKAYSKEQGRVKALGSMVRTLPAAMIPLVWKTYYDRFKVAHQNWPKAAIDPNVPIKAEHDQA